MSIVNDLYQRALELAEPERAELAHRLLLSLESTERDPDWEAAWAQELEARIAAVDRGEEVPRDWEDVLTDLRKSLRDRSP